jgi:hypothetical protein
MIQPADNDTVSLAMRDMRAQLGLGRMLRMPDQFQGYDREIEEITEEE